MADPVYEVKGEPMDDRVLLAERQRSWDRFTQATTWTIAATAVVLILLLVFVG